MRIRRNARGATGVRTLGVLVDGDHVTAAVLVDDKVTTVIDGAGSDLRERLRHVLTTAGHCDGEVIAVLADGSLAAPVAVTSTMTTYATFAEAAHAATGTSPAGARVAGVFDRARLQPGAVAPGLAVAVPGRSADLVLAEAAGPGVQVIPDGVGTGGYDGLWLHLGWEAAQLTWVANGQLQRLEQLPAGGLQGLDRRLGQGTVVGGTRTTAAIGLKGSSQALDLDADAAVQGYLTSVCGQAALARAGWVSAGLPVSTRVQVHGPAAGAPALPLALSAAGLVSHRNDNLHAAMAAVDPTQRMAYVGAFLAARSWDRANPERTLIAEATLDRVADSAVAAQARTSRRVMVASAAILLAAASAPVAGAYGEALLVRHQLGTVVQQVATRQHVSDAQVRAGADSGDNPVTIADRARTAVASHADVRQLQTSSTAGTVQLSLAIRTDTADVIADLHAAGLSVRSFATDQAARTASLTVEAMR